MMNLFQKSAAVRSLAAGGVFLVAPVAVAMARMEAAPKATPPTDGNLPPSRTRVRDPWGASVAECVCDR